MPASDANSALAGVKIINPAKTLGHCIIAVKKPQVISQQGLKDNNQRRLYGKVDAKKFKRLSWPIGRGFKSSLLQIKIHCFTLPKGGFHYVLKAGCRTNETPCPNALPLKTSQIKAQSAPWVYTQLLTFIKFIQVEVIPTL